MAITHKVREILSQLIFMCLSRYLVFKNTFVMSGNESRMQYAVRQEMNKPNQESILIGITE